MKVNCLKYGPEEFPNKISEIYPGFRDKVKGELASIPVHAVNASVHVDRESMRQTIGIRSLQLALATSSVEPCFGRVEVPSARLLPFLPSPYGNENVSFQFVKINKNRNTYCVS